MLERISEIKAELKYIETHKNVLEDLNKELEELNKSVKEKENILLKENKDVEELEKMSFKSIFHSIVGNKDDKLDKERYEASQASLEYQRVLLNYNLKKDEVERLETRIHKEESLLKELEELQLEANYHNPDLETLKEKLEKMSLELKEVHEAIVAGEQALKSTKVLYEYLSKAEDWATYDMISDSFFVNMMKRDNLDSAQKQLQVTQNAISAFERELKDVSLGHIQCPEITETEYIFDFWFDNIFTDLSVRSKIQNSLTDVKTVLSHIESTLNELYASKQALDDEVSHIKIEFRNLLLTL